MKTQPAKSLWLPGAVLFALLTVPVLALFLTTPPDVLANALGHPLVWPALRLSVITSGVSLLVIVVFGTPLAWLFARRRTRLSRWMESLIELPIVLPPAVVGVALLATFGRRGLFGGVFEALGWTPVFTTVAVVLAQVVVSAPFFVQAATAGFRGVDQELLDVARSLGATRMRTFWKVVIPLSLPALMNGAALAWARALGEFGATLLFAGNLTGTTQTLPLAIYTALESDVDVAKAISILLVCVAFVLLLLLRGPLASRLRGRKGVR